MDLGGKAFQSLTFCSNIVGIDAPEIIELDGFTDGFFEEKREIKNWMIDTQELPSFGEINLFDLTLFFSIVIQIVTKDRILMTYLLLGSRGSR